MIYTPEEGQNVGIITYYWNLLLCLVSNTAL